MLLVAVSGPSPGVLLPAEKPHLYSGTVDHVVMRRRGGRRRSDSAASGNCAATAHQPAAATATVLKLRARCFGGRIIKSACYSACATCSFRRCSLVVFMTPPFVLLFLRDVIILTLPLPQLVLLPHHELFLHGVRRLEDLARISQPIFAVECLSLATDKAAAVKCTTLHAAGATCHRACPSYSWAVIGSRANWLGRNDDYPRFTDTIHFRTALAHTSDLQSVRHRPYARRPAAIHRQARQ